MYFELIFEPFRELSGGHQEEQSPIPLLHERRLQDAAQKPAVVCEKRRLDHVKEAFGLDVVIVPYTALAERSIVAMNDADHALIESFDGIFTLESEQRIPERMRNIRGVVAIRAFRENSRDRDFDPVVLLRHLNAEFRGDRLVERRGIRSNRARSEVSKLNGRALRHTHEAIHFPAGIELRLRIEGICNIEKLLAERIIVGCDFFHR